MKLGLERFAPFILVAAAALYLKTLNFDFVYDDQWIVVQNPALEKVMPLTRFFTDPNTAALPSSGIPQDVYRPFPTLSFAINKAVSGLKPGAFRLVSLLFHLANGFLLWALLRKWTPPLAALAGALFFLLHPVQVESVVWVAQRSILMCGFGVLAGLYFWERSTKKLAWQWVAGVGYAFALLSKETALGFPLLLAFLPRHDNFRKKIFERRSIFVLLLAMAAGYLILRSAVLGRFHQGIQRETMLVTSLMEGLCALSLYIRNILWPVELNVSYQWLETVHWGVHEVWAGLLGFVGILALCFLFLKKNKTAFFGICVFLVFWFPHSGITPLVTYAADRFLYLPMAGVAICVSVFLSRLRPAPQAIWAAVLVGALSILSAKRSADWRDEKALWVSSLRENPQNPFAHACYAQALLREGEMVRAERHLEAALENRPTIPVARSVLKGLVHINKNQGDRKAELYWQDKLNRIP